MTSPWSSGADSIWDSNSPNLNLLRRYSLRSTSTSLTTPSLNITALSNSGLEQLSSANNNSSAAAAASNLQHHLSNSLAPKSTCLWEPSADNKYLVGYIVISRRDLEIYQTALGFQICGEKPTHDGHYGAIVKHVVPGSLMNVVCKLKVGDEIVEWNGFNLRNKRNAEVCDIIKSVKSTNSLRLVAIRLNSGSNNSSNNNNNNNSNTSSNTSSNNNTDNIIVQQ